MKILYVTNLYPPYNVGGYELICEIVNRAMQARGHETRVLTSSHRVPEKGLPAGEQGVERTLRIHGFFGHPWLGIRRLRALELHNNNALRQAIAEFQPDVVHVFNLGGISKSLAHTLQRANVPTVYFLSDHWLAQSLAADVWLDWWNRPPTSPAQRAVRAGLEASGVRAWLDAETPTAPIRDLKFPRIYFCSQFLRDQAIARGYDVSHGAVIHNAVDTARFTPAPSPRGPECHRLLFVGRLNAEKGVLTVLRAMALIRDSFPGTLTLCGRGEPAFEDELRTLVQKQQLPVSFVQACAATMPEIYRQHDALLFASEWEEPFALTPLEAMSCGLPVIATTTGGSKELFRHDVNALTFEAGNAEDLARQILALHRQPDLHRRIAAAGCAQARQDFREELVMDRVEQYVTETVATWPRPSRPPGSPIERPKPNALAYASND
jgi:glycosyltransferase involved in cell wall biosynthesis